MKTYKDYMQANMLIIDMKEIKNLKKCFYIGIFKDMSKRKNHFETTTISVLLF
jgi:hypothetical protein